MSTVLPIVGIILVVAGYIYYKIRSGASAEDQLDEADRKRVAEDAALREAQAREADARAAEAKRILAIADSEERRRAALNFLFRAGRSTKAV